MITACLRRVQHWSFVSILSELRHHAWPYKLFDFEQFVEYFNIDLIDLSKINMPDFITIHQNFKVSEVYSVKHLYIKALLSVIYSADVCIFFVIQSEESCLLSRCLKHYSRDERNDDSLCEKKDSHNSALVEMNEKKSSNASAGYRVVEEMEKSSISEGITTNEKNHESENVTPKKQNEKVAIDEILYVKLFFCSRNDVLSENIEFDHILRLVIQ